MSEPHEYHPEAQPYIENGEPVTITMAQSRAILHCLRVWRDLCQAEGSTQADLTPGFFINASKSRALGRLLIDGKPLFAERPPFRDAACDYALWDAENRQEVLIYRGHRFYELTAAWMCANCGHSATEFRTDLVPSCTTTEEDPQ